MKKLSQRNEQELKQFDMMLSEKRAVGQETWLSVSFIADAYGVSTRRIRALLAEGRIKGRQLENGFWEVSFPPTVRLGRRGPQIAFLQPKASKMSELKTV